MYEPNSKKSKKEKVEVERVEKKIEKVIHGTAKTRKKGKFSKFLSMFLSEDIRNVEDYIFSDVIVPTIKNGIYDTIINGASMLIFGERGRASHRGSPGSKIAYGRCFDSRENRRALPEQTRDRTPADYDDIIFETKGDAEVVLTSMDEIIERFGFVTVGDLYDLSEITTPNYNVHKYGWLDLQSANVQRVRDGYIIKLPKALPLD